MTKEFSFENTVEASGKKQAWDEKMKQIERTVDAKEKRVDEGIKECIVILQLFDINTKASCEGHLDHGVAGPLVDVESKEALELKAQWKKSTTKEEEAELRKEITQENLKERQKLITLLDEFYKGREAPFSKRLIISSLALGWSRLENQGADIQEIELKGKRESNLKEYQEEMRAFTEFLKNKFFENQS